MGISWDVKMKKKLLHALIFDEDSDVSQTIIVALHLGFKKMPWELQSVMKNFQIWRQCSIWFVSSHITFALSLIDCDTIFGSTCNYHVIIQLHC